MQPTVRFSRKDPELFFQTIRERVNAYFDENNIGKNGNMKMYAKTGTMLAMYFVPFILVLTQVFPDWANILLYLAMGMGLSGIGLSVMHDANHGSYSRKPWVNKLMSYSMNMIGGSSFTWKVQHNFLHQSFNNQLDIDEGFQANGILSQRRIDGKMWFSACAGHDYSDWK